MVNDLIQVSKNSNHLIVTTLSLEYPLSISAIFQRLKIRYKKIVTYQAVHKQVWQLCKIGILEHEGKYFKLNFDWVKKYKAFFDFAESTYHSDKRLEFPV